jgi:hypothetical protein
VEGEIGRFRRCPLVPVPKAATLAELKEHIAVADFLDDTRVITGRPITIGTAFAAEREALMPLPSEAFDPARLLLARVDKRARICERQCYYSVPARYVALRLSVRLSARTVEVFDGPKQVATHERAFGRYVEVLLLDHYLEVFKTKPGGLPGATALVQAKQVHGVVRVPALMGQLAVATVTANQPADHKPEVWVTELVSAASGDAPQEVSAHSSPRFSPRASAAARDDAWAFV